MRLLIIRHGDPDYENDTLTPKGWSEASLLAERLSKLDIAAFYVSPLGRAKATASCTLRKMQREATECEWLREFAPTIMRPDVTDRRSIAWDWLPADWTDHEEFYRRNQWMNNAAMQEGSVGAEYRWVTDNLDELLSRHGYVRDRDIYRAERPNRDTIALFCHFGLECVLLSHLCGISPMLLWHHTAAAPSSVTTVYTEERRKGIATFRMAAFGDISHLYVGGEQPSFSARFCETYDCMEERHD